MKKLICTLLLLSSFMTVFASSDEIIFNGAGKEPKWDYEYIDFENVKNHESAENGYVFNLLDGGRIYLDENGNVTDDAVGICGYNVFRSNGTAILMDNQNNIFAELSSENYNIRESGNYIWAVGNEAAENCFRIYSKENGELLLDDKKENFNHELMYINPKGTFAFCDKTGKYGISDVNGDVILVAAYEKIFSMGDAFILVKEGGWSILDYNGELLLELEENEIPSKMEGNEKYTTVNYKSAKLFDENYELVYDYGENKTVYSPCEGVALLQNLSNDYMSVANYDGEIIIPEKAHTITCLEGGLFEAVSEDGYYSRTLYNADGQIIASGYRYEPFAGDNGLIGISKDDFEGFIDKDGNVKIVLENGYRIHGSFSNGLAPIVKNVIYGRIGEVSYVNENGELMLEASGNPWRSGGDFKNGLFTVGMNLGKQGPENHILVRCVYDTPSDWARETVEKAVDAGIVDEAQQRRYRKNITREDFCELAYNLPSIKAACDGTKENVGQKFSDTDNEKILKLSALGIIEGIGGGRFAPDEYITREEAAAILERIINKTVIDIAMTSDYIMFDDDTQISPWAKKSIQAVAHLKIMQGVGDNLFAPKSAYTTEQTIATLMRIYDYE